MATKVSGGFTMAFIILIGLVNPMANDQNSTMLVMSLGTSLSHNKGSNRGPFDLQTTKHQSRTTTATNKCHILNYD